MIGAYIGGVAFLAVPAMCLWALIDGFRKGGMLARGHRYSRVVEPTWFWVLATTYTAIAVTYFGLLTYMLVGDGILGL